MRGLYSLENKQSTMINEQQSRSPAIAIVRSNNYVPPQAEPFYRPKHLPATNQQPLSHSPTNDFISHSLPNNSNSIVPPSSTKTTNINDKKQRSKASEEHPEGPRTPHSRAKNLPRFYPVTKDASVVKPDVNFFFILIINRFCVFRHLVLNVKHVIVKIHQ
jgi:hypothetical protein